LEWFIGCIRNYKICGGIWCKKIRTKNVIGTKSKVLDAKWLANSEIHSETGTEMEFWVKSGVRMKDVGAAVPFTSKQWTRLKLLQSTGAFVKVFLDFLYLKIILALRIPVDGEYESWTTVGLSAPWTHSAVVPWPRWS
jgi:hypothetical protein